MSFSLRAAVRTVGTPIAIFSAIAFFSFATNTACSTDESTACEDAKCAAGNKCINFEGATKCQRLCTSNAEAASSCPFNYTCTQVDGVATPICVQTTAKLDDGKPLVKKPTGQWGADCRAALGVENPDCDGEQGFFCQGLGPSDGDAYCTRYNCTADRDCGAGFYCGKVNTTPNVAKQKRTTFGETEAVCLRRAYCAPCKVDLDCPAKKGTSFRCVPDAKGQGFCAPECGKTANCNNESECKDPGIGTNICFPLAGSCVGDGSLCSPCRNDGDCGADGVCIKGQYTTEKTCAKKAPGDCKGGEATDGGGCQADVDLAGRKVRVACAGGIFDNVPKNYCHGLYFFNTSAVAPDRPSPDTGCWSPDRK